MEKYRRPWRQRLGREELVRGWIFFGLYVLVFPWLMGWVQRSFQGALPVAESNVVYYLLSVTLVFLAFWSFLKGEFRLLVDWLPENLFAFATGLAGAGVLWLGVSRLPLPVTDPNPAGYREQFLLSPQATALILVVLMPIVEEVLFRGLLFGALRPLRPALAWVLSAGGYALYCVWQFIYASGVLDLRYLLLAVRYLPPALACTWCYDRGRSIWSAVALHMALNGAALAGAVGS